ncbi:antizyme inhibitor 2-like [Ciona intestinalis]
MHAAELACLEPHISLKPPVYGVAEGEGRKELAKTFVCSQKKLNEWDSSFYIGDLGQVVRNLQLWTKHMRQIRPYYAMKCNPSQPVVQLLASLGVGFDCASKFEIESALKCGVKPDDILFAIPCKISSHIEYACRTGVRTMTFDNVDELHKIKRIHPTGKLLLRLDVTDFEKGIKFGDKFGASMPKARKLTLLCKELDLNLVGICFHPGSGSDSSEATRNCLQHCKELYDFATSNEVHLKTIDIGGGFICGENFIEISEQVTATVGKLFPPKTGVRVIAEPGRFFVKNAFEFVTPVHGKAIVGDRAKYYIGAGVFSTFCMSLFEELKRIPESLSRKAVGVLPKSIYKLCLQETCELYPSTVYGPTCAGVDVVLNNILLPEAQIGDWWFFDNMGAYSSLLSLGFNGYMVLKTGFYISQNIW